MPAKRRTAKKRTASRKPAKKRTTKKTTASRKPAKKRTTKKTTATGAMALRTPASAPPPAPGRPATPPPAGAVGGAVSGEPKKSWWDRLTGK